MGAVKRTHPEARRLQQFNKTQRTKDVATIFNEQMRLWKTAHCPHRNFFAFMPPIHPKVMMVLRKAQAHMLMNWQSITFGDIVAWWEEELKP